MQKNNDEQKVTITPNSKILKVNNNGMKDEK